MEDISIEAHKNWYLNNRSTYEGLSDICRSTVESLLRHENVDYLSVSCRTKTVDSFTEKISRKNYKNPQQDNTDFSGVRIITYLETDVEKVCGIISRSFNVRPELSFDKSKELGVDRFGYRSVHFVCDLGSARLSLPEFQAYNDLLFEIQVRTVLQHAWAEIEHDRNYKLSGVLPSQLQRRLYSLAGMLEIVDREFVALAHEVEAYAEKVIQKTKAGDLSVEVNSTSLLQFLPELFESLGIENIDPLNGPADIELVTKELKLFGVNTLLDLKVLMNERFVNVAKEYDADTTYTGVLRSSMMYENIDKYFQVSWQNSWRGLDFPTYKLLLTKYRSRKIQLLVRKYDIDIDSDI